MKRVISFSLWGNNPTYSHGALENAKLALKFYPDFECWFYIHKDTVKAEVINELSALKNVKIVFKAGDLSDLSVKPMMWRFEPIDDPDVEVMLSRDTDTRFLEREKMAVMEWLHSNKTFHIMRDHPHHAFKILGGMFGTRKFNNFSWTKSIQNYPRNSPRDYDQKFLEDIIYPQIKDSALIHTSFKHYDGESYKPFPIEFSEKHDFVGEYIYADDSRSIPHLINLLQEISEPIPPNLFDLKAKNQPIVSVVIGTYQRIDFLPLTINSVREDLKNIPHEIIVVDGGSTDGTLDWLIKQKDIITIIQHNRGEWKEKPISRRSWGYFMNLGFKSAQGKFICMLSDDCIVTPNSIKNGLSLFERSLKADLNIGAIAFYWRNWPRQNEYVVGQTWGDKMFVNHGLYLNDALCAVNYVDEEMYSFYHADGDLCLKIWERGFTVIDSPHSFIEHFVDPSEEVRSSNQTSQPRDWETYTGKWKPIFGDASQDWLVRYYDDPTQSALKFTKAGRRKLTFKKIINYLK